MCVVGVFAFKELLTLSGGVHSISPALKIHLLQVTEVVGRLCED